MKQYPSYIYTEIQPYIFPMLGLRFFFVFFLFFFLLFFFFFLFVFFFFKIQKLRNPTCKACKYIFNLAAAHRSRLFGSVVKALDFYSGRPGSDPTTGGKCYQLCFIPLLRLSYRKTPNDYDISLSFLRHKRL